jgi:AraC-like DNA-binding protein
VAIVGHREATGDKLAGKADRDQVPGIQHEGFVRPNYFEYHPQHVDHDCIEAFWSFRPSESAEYRVLPDGRVDLLARFDVGADEAVSKLVLIVAGPARRFSMVPANPHTGFLGVRFRPGWGAACLGLHPETLRDRTLLGEEVHRLLGDVADPMLRTGTLSGLRQSLLNAARVLASRVQPDSRFTRATAAIRLLHDCDGACPVDRLARAVGVSTRTLHRDILATAGLPAKSLAAVFRFQRSMRTLRTEPSLSLARLAADAGYSDQSHMTREFRQLGGFTPAARPDVAVINMSGFNPAA